MKNKLTTEEQGLRSKLDGASFSYSEASWAEMQQKLAKPSATGFSSLLKAAIGLLTLTVVVVLMNTLYSDEKLSTADNTETTSTETEQTTTEVEGNLSSDAPLEVTKVEPQATKVASEQINTIENNGKVVSNEATSASNSQTNDLSDTNEEPKTNSNDNIPNNTENFEIDNIKALSPLCVNSEINLSVIAKESAKGILFKWFVNGSQISGTNGENTHIFTTSGNFNLLVKAYSGSELLSQKEINLSVATAPVLDFVATDLEDPFYDNNVNLKVSFPVDGEYRWYVNPRERVQFNKETAWFFEEEGEYAMTLEHKSSEGCLTTNTQMVSMKKDFIEAFPEQFTPDNDGHNDEFVLEVFQLRDDKFELNIFDLNNNLVFKSNDPKKGWNGRLHNTGELLPFKTYVWTVQIENKNGRKRIFKDKIKIFKID